MQSPYLCGFQLFAIETGDALVATLVYRMLTFWLPIPLGGVAAYVFRRRHPHQVPAGAAPATPS